MNNIGSHVKPDEQSAYKTARDNNQEPEDVDLCPGSTRSTEPPRRQPKRDKSFEISGDVWSRGPPPARSFRLVYLSWSICAAARGSNKTRVHRYGQPMNSERFCSPSRVYARRRKPRRQPKRDLRDCRASNFSEGLQNLQDSRAAREAAGGVLEVSRKS